MSLSDQSYYMKFLRCARCSHDFEYGSPLYHPITLSICGHTMFRPCIDIIYNQTKCPQDQISLGINHTPNDHLPINYPLFFLIHQK